MLIFFPLQWECFLMFLLFFIQQKLLNIYYALKNVLGAHVVSVHNIDKSFELLRLPFSEGNSEQEA